MTEYININTNETTSILNNRTTIHRYIIMYIVKFSNIYNFTEIKTYGNIITNLMDIIPSFNRDKKSLTIILAGRIKVHLDSDMIWDDNRLIPIYDDLYIRKLKMNKIKNTNCEFTILKEIKLNNYNF